MGMIQESIDRQAAAIEHAAIIDRLTKISPPRSSSSPPTASVIWRHIAFAFVDLLNHALAVRLQNRVVVTEEVGCARLVAEICAHRL